MDFYYFLKSVKPEEISQFVKMRIDELENESVNKKDYLGYRADENPKPCIDEGTHKGGVEVRCFHKGYLKKGTKIVYGLTISLDGKVENEGNYYYLNDDQYIYDFCKFISQFDIENEYELFDKILLFIRFYFGTIKMKERDEMFPLLYDKSGKSFPLKKEHDLNLFKHQGSAMCSEFTVMAQNLLSIFDIDCYAVIGTQKVGKEEAESHAFNFVSFDEEIDGEMQKTNLLLDFSGFVNVYDVKRDKLGESPFIGYVETFDDDFVHRFLYDEEHLIYEDYNYAEVGDALLQVLYGRDRDYYVSNDLVAKTYVAQKKRR